MSNWEDLKSSICRAEFNYCENEWKKFTLLTEEEEKILEKIKQTKYLFFKKKKKHKKVICVETKEIFENINIVAARNQCCVETMRKYIKKEIDFFGKHYKYL